MTAAATALASLERLAAAFEGTLAVAARDEHSGETVELDATRRMSTASTIKLGVLATVYARAQDGALSLDERIAIRDEERVGGSGVIKDLSAGTELTIRDLATYMVTVSDNMATNLLIDAAGGVEEVNRYVNQELGLEATTLHRKLQFTGGRGPLALASPHDLMTFVSGLQAGTIVSPEASREMLGMLARQQYLDQVPRLLDWRRVAESEADEGEVRVAAKTGMVDGVRADAGVIWLSGRPLSYAVMTESAGDGGRDLDADGQLVNAEAGAILVGAFWSGDGPPPLAPHPARVWERLHRAVAGEAAQGAADGASGPSA